MTESTKNLYQKISEITDAIGVIQKDSEAPQAMGGYKFISHGIVMAHLRHELTSRNVVIIPSGEELLRADVTEKRVKQFNNNGDEVGEKVTYNYRSVIKFLFRVVNGDSPDQYFDAYWIGEGMDTQDKGIQKAGTSAEKYFLMKLFKIGDKDDPDAINSNKDDDQKQEPAKKATQSVSASMDKTPPADSKPVDVPVNQVPANSNGNDADLKKNQLKALIWFGEQLPADKGWFPGKITALVQLYDAKEKKGTLTDEERQSGGAIKHVFGQIAQTHHEVCGENCPHILASQLAVVLGGTIQDPAK